MNKHHLILGIIIFILTIFIGCEKDVPKYISLDCKLVDEFGHESSEFKQSDSLFFEFYLSNFSGETAIYLRPFVEFGDYLNIFREDPDGIYNFYGRPTYYVPTVAIYDSIYDGKSLMLCRTTWIDGFEWPERKPGKYYVGDTLSLKVNSKLLKTLKRIYFEIK